MHPVMASFSMGRGGGVLPWLSMVLTYAARCRSEVTPAMRTCSVRAPCAVCTHGLRGMPHLWQHTWVLAAAGMLQCSRAGEGKARHAHTASAHSAQHAHSLWGCHTCSGAPHTGPVQGAVARLAQRLLRCTVTVSEHLVQHARATINGANCRRSPG